LSEAVGDAKVFSDSARRLRVTRFGKAANPHPAGKKGRARPLRRRPSVECGKENRPYPTAIGDLAARPFFREVPDGLEIPNPKMPERQEKKKPGLPARSAKSRRQPAMSSVQCLARPRAVKWSGYVKWVTS